MDDGVARFFTRFSLHVLYKYTVKIQRIQHQCTHTRARVDQKIQLEMAEEKRDWADHPWRQSLGAVWKSRWPSWAPVPNKPTVSVDVKQRSANPVEWQL